MGRRAQRTSSEELHHIILGPTKGKYYRPTEPCDEVYPGIFIGDSSAALSTCLLKELKITHVLNAAHGKNDRYNYGYVNTSFANYMQAGIKFMGIHAQDTPSCYLRPYFQQAADFIEESLKSGGKVLSHCLCGISRSSTLVAAYLMIKKGMSVEEAISTLRKHRSIYPNQGFLSQLCDFEYELKRSGKLPNTKKPMAESCNVDRTMNSNDPPKGDNEENSDKIVATTKSKTSNDTSRRSMNRSVLNTGGVPTPRLVLSSSDIIPDPKLKSFTYTKSSPYYYYSNRPYTMPYYEPYNFAKYSIYDEYPFLIPDFMTYPRPDCYIPPVNRVIDAEYFPTIYNSY